MKDIKVFEDKEVKLIIGDDGEPLFELYSTGLALGYSKEVKEKVYPRKDRIDNVLKNADISTVVHGGQLYLTESSVYDFIFEAKTEKCKPFRRWVTNDVLPSIRKYDAYMTDNLVDKIYEDPQMMIDLLTKLKNEKEARVEADRRNNILMHTNKTYTATEIAKELGFKSAVSLNKDLCNKGIQYKVNNTYVFYSEYAGLGYDSIKQQILDSGKEVYNRHFTQDGRKFLLDLYNIQDKAN